jgi:transcriptional regulator with XRE-family HTH domain
VKLHIGKEIEKQIKLNGISKSEFARRIAKSRQNVEDILKRESIDSALLYKISSVLKFDFFEPYSNSLGINKPEDSTTTNKDKELESLKKEISYLEEINTLLKKNKK